MLKRIDKNQSRKKRHARVRRKISGTAEKPRLCVYRSGQHIYAQIINDDKGHTLVSASTVEKSLNLEKTGNVEAAKAIGKEIGKRALDQGIEEVVFDRSGYIYHGKIKALAEAAREAGLKF
ncbi:MAG: 50S ribosomal protein L18 [Tissierellia bacterium]|nr:50S ribosomal protein L18 [Tissierellia bacterium]